VNCRKTSRRKTRPYYTHTHTHTHTHKDLYHLIVQVADEESPPDDGLGVTGSEVQFYGQTFKLCTDGLVLLMPIQSLSMFTVTCSPRRHSADKTGVLVRVDVLLRQQSALSTVSTTGTLAFGTNLTPISRDRLTVLSGCPRTEHALLCPQQPAGPHRTGVKSN
jgi:hypothetical protein